jgi:hypothetical protein
MGGTPPVVQTDELVNNSKRLHISFSLPTRGVDYQYLPIGVPHPMLLVAVVGDAAFYKITQERIAVERCLDALRNIGCFVPNFSYFKIKQLKTGKSTMVQTVDRLLQGTSRCGINYIFLFHS